MTFVATLEDGTQGLFTAGLNIPGDFDRDGQLTMADTQTMLTALADLKGYQSNQGLSDAELLTIGDLDHDGKVTNADLQALLTKLQTGGGSLTPVPEPTCVVLLALAVPGLVLAIARSRGSSLRYRLAQ